MNKEKLTIGFIGAGRVGFTLGRYFFDKNLEISGFLAKLMNILVMQQNLHIANHIKLSES